MYVKYSRYAYICTGKYDEGYAVYGNLLVVSLYILSEDVTQFLRCVPLSLNSSKTPFTYVESFAELQKSLVTNQACENHCQCAICWDRN